jgi:hypothetical protein
MAPTASCFNPPRATASYANVLELRATVTDSVGFARSQLGPESVSTWLMKQLQPRQRCPILTFGNSKAWMMQRTPTESHG